MDLRVKRLAGEQASQTSNMSSLVAAAKDSLTVIYVPGNRTTWEVAIQEGQRLYASLLSCRSPQPITLIIWSWPSDRIPRPLKDVRVKAFRAYCEGPYLAWLLARLDESSQAAKARLSLIGYSFGSRIILGALHVWNGGHVAGVQLPHTDVASATRVRTAFLAPAEHNHWLQPGDVHGLAYGRIDHALNLYNSCDKTLKGYRFVDKCGRPHALGFTGLADRSRFPDGAARFHEYDACCDVGEAHDYGNYLADEVLVEQISHYALWDTVCPFCFASDHGGSE